MRTRASKRAEDALREEIRRRVALAPKEPGVYRWLDAKGTVLYVGKAKNLRNRLQSYMKEKPDPSIGPWKLSLLRRIADFDVTITANELEALILETTIIKDLRPKYNVLMKDDKNYVYVCVSAQEPYPRVEVVRRMEEKHATYFGPFLSAYDTERTLELLQSVFCFRACRGSLERLNAGEGPPGKGCTASQIGQCCGLCAGRVTREEYRRRIEEVMRFFRGDRRAVIARLKELMREAAAVKKFERAAKLRDTLSFIESLEEQQVVSEPSGANTDVVGVALQSGKAQIVLLRQRDGKIVEEMSFSLAGEAESAPEVLAQFLPQYYTKTMDIPEAIVIAEPIEEQDLLEQWFREDRGKRVRILVPERGKKSRLLQMAEKNALEKVRLQFARWEAEERNVLAALQELQETLGLSAIPQRIEGYDISHLSGTETVGSMVVMKSGKPANAEYRSFTLRTMKEGEVDDTKALREVLLRRLRRLTQSLQAEEEQWRRKGIMVRRGRKADAETIAKFLNRGQAPVDVRAWLLALRKEHIVGTIEVCKLPKALVELRSLNIAPQARGGRLGHFLLRKALQPLKKGKAYVVCSPELQERYAEAGFRHVLAPPPVLSESIGQMRESGVPEPLVMVYDAREHKPDASLSARPDLLVVDGGKGQLGAALAALRETVTEIPVIALAKREEEVFVPTKSKPLPFPSDSPAKFLLMRLRDEAHRCANRHREKRMKTRSIISALDEIAGIGQKTRSLLLGKFGSVAGVAAASDAELRMLLTAAQLTSLREKFPPPSSAA